MRISLLLLAVVLSACSDDDGAKAPLTPGGGPGNVVDENRPDSGRTVDDEDAGSTPDAGEGPMAGECRRIDALVTDADELPTVTSTSSPRDFMVTRVVGTWKGDCPNPRLVIELSNGICPSGQGHELEFWFPSNAIADGSIGLGLTLIEPDSVADAIRIRYTRPERWSPVGVYGNCDDSGMIAAGYINFYDAPDITRAMNVRASYELTLVPCDGKSNPAQMVAGFFDVRVPRDIASVCPP
jgi:hypothetical protein